MLTEIQPGVLFVLGLAAGAPFLWLLLRRLRLSQKALRNTRRDLEIRQDALDAAHDGFFLWNIEDGTETCSRRLAVLLGLDAGTEAGFSHLLDCFDAEAAGALDDAVEGLRRHGAGFELDLPLGDEAAGRRVRITGIRCGDATADYQTDNKADLLWVRDVSPPRPAVSAAVPAAVPGLPPSFEAEAAEPGRFRAFLDALPWPVWLRDGDYQPVYANRACLGENMAGHTKGLAARAREAGQAMSESHLMTVGDEPRLYDIFEAPVAGWTGSIGYALDKSEREEMEGRLTLDALARDQVLEAVNTAVAVYGPGKNLTFFNPAFAALWELDEAWLAGGPVMSEVLERLRKKRRLPEVADWTTYREEQLGRFGNLTRPQEELLHLPDGTTVREVASPHSLGGLVLTFEDVTHGLSLERSLKTLTAVQGETLSNLYEGVCVFGSDGRLRLFNPAFAGLWGLAADFLEGGPHMNAVIEAMKPHLNSDSTTEADDWRETRERFIQRLIGRVPSTGRVVKTDGQVLDYANVPLPDGAVMLSYLNVTDQTQVEFALRQRAEALEEAGRLKSEFIANVSHEVRAPINTIIGFADMLAGEHYGKLNPRQMEYGQGILKTSKNLMTLIDDILDLAAIEAGLMRLELDTVDLHVLLASVLGLVRERARRKSLKLEFDCPPDIGWIVADEKRLKQVIFNLLSNAIEFTPDRGTISLKGAREKDSVVLTVRDSGIGIPKKEMQRIMGAFERGGEMETDGETSRRGAGLGLSLVKRFVELHDGAVGIKSRPGKGTSVIVRLPAEAAEKETEEPEQGSLAGT